MFSRAQLLQEVWGYDYFGGTRTVDVHVRRLRAKLGSEHESLIGTIRNVGYRFVADRPRRDRRRAPRPDRPSLSSCTVATTRRGMPGAEHQAYPAVGRCELRACP